MKTSPPYMRTTVPSTAGINFDPGEGGCGVPKPMLDIGRPKDHRNGESEAQPKLVAKHGNGVPRVTVVTCVGFQHAVANVRTDRFVIVVRHAVLLESWRQIHGTGTVPLENLKTSEGKGIILSLILLRCPFLSRCSSPPCSRFSVRARARQLENLALRHQIGVLQRSRVWSGWHSTLAIVQPETVLAWHRAGFRLFWTWKVQRGRPGRPVVSRESRDLIRSAI